MTTNSQMVNCPLGSRCPKGGMHRAGTQVFREHQEQAQRDKRYRSETHKGNARDRRPEYDYPQPEYSDVFPVDPPSDDSMEAWAMPAAVFAKQIYDYKNDGKMRTLSSIGDIAIDEETDSFAVQFTTKDSFVFDKSEDNPGYFEVTHYSPASEEGGEMMGSTELVAAEDVMDYIQDKDKEITRGYIKGAAASAAATYGVAQVVKYHKKRKAKKRKEKNEREKLTMSNDPATQWISKFLDRAFPFLK